VYLLRNPHDEDRTVTFTAAPVWEKHQPALFRDGQLAAGVHDLETGAQSVAHGEVTCTIPAHGCKLIALLPEGETPVARNGMLTFGKAELCRML
jgi:hypothetical protein